MRQEEGIKDVGKIQRVECLVLGGIQGVGRWDNSDDSIQGSLISLVKHETKYFFRKL